MELKMEILKIQNKKNRYQPDQNDLSKFIIYFKTRS